MHKTVPYSVSAMGNKSGEGSYFKLKQGCLSELTFELRPEW